VRKATRTRKPAVPLVVESLQQLEADLGGRRAIVGMLALAPLTPDLEDLLGMLGDERRYPNESLATLCAQAHVLPGDLIQMLTSAALLQGKVRAAQKVGQGIAAVAQDVVRRAAPYVEPCYACMVNGVSTGTYTPEPTTNTPNPSPVPCETCKGSKELLHQPDLDRQKLALEMAQLLPKGGGLSITNQQLNIGGSGGGGGTLGFNFIDQIQQLADQGLYGDAPLLPAAIEADVVDVVDVVEPPAE
jgi:hypothetical protein